MIEKWKDISGYEGYYQVSTFGRVRAMGHKYQRKGIYILALHENNGYGYLLADLHKDNKYKSVAVHRLLAQTFIPNPENKPEVNHIDGNKQNNNVSNLEWVTHGENIQHSYDSLGRKHGMLGRKGKNSPYSKKIQQIKDNKVIAEFWGCFEAERTTGVFAPNIWACLKNQRKTAGGYLWKYATEQ